MDLRRVGKRIRCVVAVPYEEKEWDWSGGMCEDVAGSVDGGGEVRIGSCVAGFAAGW